MATKIRRCLYIGLGGTGMKTLLHTKKMFIDTYGEVPPMVGFLGIDTDGGEYTKSIKSLHGEDIKLMPNEQLQLVAPGAVDFYLNCKPDFTWVPQCNINAISMLKNNGAGGVRSNGRMSFTINKNRVTREVATKINDITNANIITNNKYSLLANGLPEIHMVFSVCGGTGCGTFLNMAYLLRELNSRYKITGYAVLPGVFNNLPACGHATPNTYGALVDLDYLMHHGIGNNPIDIKYINEKYSATERPFSSVYFVDNENANNTTYDDVESLTEMISLALITAAGELSVAGTSIGDNFDNMIEEGNLDIENKKAWAGGLGACEILYRGNTLAEIYNMKAAQHIITRLFNSCEDANVIANAWIDSAAVHIRENNGRDDVTDYIASKIPQYELVIDDKDNPRPEVDANIQRNKISADESTEKIKELLERSRSELRKLIITHINGECGISTAENIIEELKIQIAICLREMHEEKGELSNKVKISDNKIENLIKEIADMTSFFKRSERRKLCEDLCNEIKTHNQLLRDIQRHDCAITFYNSLMVTLDECNSRIKIISEKIRKVRLSLTEKINKLQFSSANSNSIFQINLAEEDAKNITVRTEDIIISEFVNSLSGNRIYDFSDEVSAGEIEKNILSYTSKLEGAKIYRNRSVDDVLRDIYKKDPNELIRIIEKAYQMSMPLFKYDHIGRAPKQNMIEMIYLGVEDKDNSIFRIDNLFENNIPRTQNTNVDFDVDFASIGMKDKIIIYHQIGVVPIYALAGMEKYKSEYIRSSRGPEGYHFDDDIRLRMEREDFDISPRRQHENNNLIDYWVKGFIYGLIKNEDDMYKMKSKSLGNALDKYWVSLGSSYRSDAFEEFSRKEINVVRDFAPHFTNEISSRGDDAIRALIADVKENYFDKYSQLKLDRSILDSPAYKKVRDLMESELRHVETL